MRKLMNRISSFALAAAMLMSGGAVSAAAESGSIGSYENGVYSSVSYGALSIPVIKSSCLATTSSVKIYWGKISGASGYRVYRYNRSTKKWDTVKTLGAASLGYTDTKLKEGTEYKYKVKPYKRTSTGVVWGTASKSKGFKTKSRAEAMSAYKNMLSKSKYTGGSYVSGAWGKYWDGYSFCTKDINSDGVPELFLNDGTGIGGGSCYQYYQGQIRKILWGTNSAYIDSYYPKKGIIINYFGSGAGSVYLYTRVYLDGTAKHLGTHNETPMDGYVSSDYYWNKGTKAVAEPSMNYYSGLNKVTKSIFNKKLNSAVGSEKRVLVSGFEFQDYNENRIWTEYPNTAANRTKYLK